MSDLLITCVQLDGSDAPVEKRIEHAVDVASAAPTAQAAAELMVLPELWPVGFFHAEDWRASAEHADRIDAAMSDLARERGCWLHAGSRVELTPDGRMHNLATVHAPDGSVAARYRKVHLFGLDSDEQRLMAAGESGVVVETGEVVAGLLTCYDLRFPEQARAMSAAGAGALVVSAAWPAARTAHWRALLVARAIENLSYVVACGTAGSDAGVPMAGHSLVAAPDGTLLAESATDETVLQTVVELGRIAEVRASLPFLGDRRYPDTVPLISGSGT